MIEVWAAVMIFVTIMTLIYVSVTLDNIEASLKKIAESLAEREKRTQEGR